MQSHMLLGVPAVELSRMLVRDAILPTDRETLARHFVLVLRANPTFSWVSYSARPDRHRHWRGARGQHRVPERFNYTVMGDTVNLASRLEGLNKLYGTAVLVSEATYRAARDRVVGRPVDIVQVKGRQSGVKVYELLCLATEEDQEARDLAALGEQGLDAYLARDFEAAAGRFDAMVRLRPRDLAAALLLERCRELIAAPPPADWTGVYIATQK